MLSNKNNLHKNTETYDDALIEVKDVSLAQVLNKKKLMAIK